MTDILEPPAVIATSPQIGASSGFEEALSQHNGPGGMPLPEQPKEQETAPKQEVAPPAKPEQSTAKNPWDKLDVLKAPEEKKEEPKETAKTEQSKEETNEVKEDESPQKKRWGELRKKEERLEKEVLPEYERVKAELQELKGKPQIPAETQERLDFLEQKYAVDNLVNNQDYQKEVLMPWSETEGEIESSGKHAGLESAQMAALREAIKEKDGFARNKQIRSIMSTGGKVEDEQDLASLITTTQQAANRLHKEIWPKDARYQSEAGQIAMAAKGKETQLTVQQQQARDAEYTKAHGEIFNTVFQPKLDFVLKDNPDAVTALKSAKPASDPMNSAYQAQAGIALPYLITEFNKMLKENAELKRVQGIKNDTKPRDGDGRQPEVKVDHKIDLMDALGATFGGNGR